MKLRPQIATPGETIIVEGDIGDRMFFVGCGKVEILTSDGKILRLLGRGDFLGEFALLTAELRSASAIARTFSLLHVLLNHDFDRIMSAWPEYNEAMEQACHARLASAAHVTDREREQSQHASRVISRRGSKDLSSHHASSLGVSEAADIRSIYHCLRAAAEWKAKLGFAVAKGCGSTSIPRCISEDGDDGMEAIDEVVGKIEKCHSHPFGVATQTAPPSTTTLHAPASNNRGLETTVSNATESECITRGLLMELHGSMHKRLDRLEAMSLNRHSDESLNKIKTKTPSSRYEVEDDDANPTAGSWQGCVESNGTVNKRRSESSQHENETSTMEAARLSDYERLVQKDTIAVD
eukprot:SAG31_NODE_2772_length_5116_cov_2.136336_2_plen_352_part_00